MIQFGEWLPDQPDYMNTGVTEATNVVPQASGYAPLNEFVSYSNSATGTLKNVFAAKDNSGNIKLFAGDATKLYEFNSGTSNLDETLAPLRTNRTVCFVKGKRDCICLIGSPPFAKVSSCLVKEVARSIARSVWDR